MNRVLLLRIVSTSNLGTLTVSGLGAYQSFAPARGWLYLVVKSGKPAMTGKSPLPAVPEGRGTAIGYLAAVLLIPWLVIWSQDNPLFTGYGYIDPWVYFGYFRNLVEFKRNLFFGSSYGANQSWILPGAALHTLFAPVTATSLLHLGVHTLATTSLFLTLKWVAGARRAFVTAMVFGVNPWFGAATGGLSVD